MATFAVTDQWMDINTLSGIPVGTQFTIQNVGVNILYIVNSELEPEDDKGLILFDVHREELSICTIPPLASTIWLKAKEGQTSLIAVDSTLNIGDPQVLPPDLITSWPVNNRRLKVETLTLGNRYVVDGIGFSVTWLESAIPTGQSRYAIFNVPAGFYVALDDRTLNPSSDNMIYRVYPQGTYSLGAIKTETGSNFIRARNYRQDSGFNPSLVARYNIGETVPTDTQFVVYATAFGAVGAGNRSEGGVGSDDAFLLLDEDQQFLLEIKNNGSTNPLSALVSLSLALIPTVSIPPPVL